MANRINEQYKIKIYCTYKGELTLNNYLIEDCSSQHLKYALQPYYYTYIDEICKLYRTNKHDNTVTLSLEIFCNRWISNREFSDFIYNMYRRGFRSCENNIEFINTRINEVVYKYDFVNIRNLPIYYHTPKKNNSDYSRYRIFYKN